MKHWQVATSLALAAAMLAGCAVLHPGAASGTAAGTATAEPAQPETPAPTPEPTPVPGGNLLTGEAGNYTNKRPVAVQLRTGDSALPQWGVARADLLIEGVTEGKTASLMAIFPSVDDLGKVGPVAAGRDLMLQFALPLNAVPVHIDKNQYASNLLNLLTYQDLDGYHIGKAAFAFDTDRNGSGYAEENCFYTTPDLLRAGLESYGASAEGASTKLFRFGERPAPAAQNGTELYLTFSDEDTEALVYSPDTGLYLKNNNGGSPMMDADTGDQAAFTNVFVLYVSSGVKDDGITRDYDFAAGGTGLYLTQGGWQEIRWQKGDATAPLVLTDAAGQGVTVNAGKSFIGIYGGYYGQAVKLLGSDGTEQTLPAAPALMASGIPNDAAAAAEEAYNAQQEAIAASEAEIAASQAAEEAAEEAEAESDSTAEGEAPADAAAATPTPAPAA